MSTVGDWNVLLPDGGENLGPNKAFGGTCSTKSKVETHGMRRYVTGAETE